MNPLTPSLAARLRPKVLSEAVHREFVDALFAMRLPVVGMGVVFLFVTILIGRAWHDPFLDALALLSVPVTIGRHALMSRYARVRPIVGRSALRVWERRYAIGNYGFAILLAALSGRVIGRHDPLVTLIAISLVFSFDAGIVARISVRPVVCAVSLLLATAPTIAALGLQALRQESAALGGELFAVEAFLMTMIMGLSLQTIAHLYRSAVEHHTSRQDLARMARYDALTGLANRLALRERFEAAVADARGEVRLALHFIDLDGFKAVNDTFGHPAGDAVLTQVADRLVKVVRAQDVVARLGGDEFVILQADVADESEAELLGRRLVKNLSAPYGWESEPIQLSASVGIALRSDQACDLETLLAHADHALYGSKAAGKRTVTFYDHRLPDVPIRDLALENGRRA